MNFLIYCPRDLLTRIYRCDISTRFQLRELLSHRLVSKGWSSGISRLPIRFTMRLMFSVYKLELLRRIFPHCTEVGVRMPNSESITPKDLAFLKFLDHFHSMECVRLDGAAESWAALMKMNPSVVALKRPDFNRVNENDGADQLLTRFAYVQSLQYLKLKGTLLLEPLEFEQPLSALAKSLTSLSLSIVIDKTATTVSAMSVANLLSRLTALRTLKIVGPLSDSEVCSLTKISTLESLSLRSSNRWLSGPPMAYRLVGYLTSLQRLRDIKLDCIVREDFELLAYSLLTQVEKIRGHLAGSRYEVSAEALRTFATRMRNLKECSSLTLLGLRHTTIPLLAHFTRLESLTLHQTHISTVPSSEIHFCMQSLRNLRTVSIVQKLFPIDGFTALCTLERIEHLTLAGFTSVPSQNYYLLSKLTSLRSLTARELFSFPEDGFGVIFARAWNLERVFFDRVSATELRSLENCSRLTSFTCLESPISEDSILCLSSLSSLQELDFTAMPLTGSTFANVRYLTSLTSLAMSLDRLPITTALDPRCAKLIAKFPKLYRLDIAGLRADAFSVLCSNLASSNSLRTLTLSILSSAQIATMAIYLTSLRKLKIFALASSSSSTTTETELTSRLEDQLALLPNLTTLKSLRSVTVICPSQLRKPCSYGRVLVKFVPNNKKVK